MAPTTKTFRILSGTRDELGGVELGIANIYERKERPGVLSGLMVLDAGDIIVAVGDEISLGTGRFRLQQILPHRTGAYDFLFVEIKVPPEEMKSRKFEIDPVSGQKFVWALKNCSQDILEHLGCSMAILDWEETSKDSIETSWNGEKIGPSTAIKHRARFEPSQTETPSQLEASIQIEFIRWSPDDLYRVEVSGFWRHEEPLIHLFARGEGHGDLRNYLSSTMPDEVHQKVLLAITKLNV